MGPLRKIGTLIVSILVSAFFLLELVHLIRFGHFLPPGLHADVLVRKADYGIPGISKTYQATLTNFGITPVRITVCDFIDDAMAHGIEVSYTLEKWDPLAKRWVDLFSDADKSSWCQPYPTGIVDGHVISKKLWPGQSISGSEGAIAAYDVFAIGDKARFVVFARNGLAFRTASFSIDEHQTHPGVPYRVRH
ncbi:MAG TPA: hypothetical protein VJN89_00230 [Candidatus Acidoferrum sp.]|nr:hypothetical protein [Candidatus Acidoferrum sp.]